MVAHPVLLGLMLALLVAVVVVLSLLDRKRERRNRSDEISRAGLSWAEVRAKLEQGEGTAVVDVAQGKSRGVGRRVVWWCKPNLAEATDDELLETLLKEGKLTECPLNLLNVEALRRYFPRAIVRENRWVRSSLNRRS